MKNRCITTLLMMGLISLGSGCLKKKDAASSLNYKLSSETDGLMPRLGRDLKFCLADELNQNARALQEPVMRVFDRWMQPLSAAGFTVPDSSSITFTLDARCKPNDGEPPEGFDLAIVVDGSVRPYYTNRVIHLKNSTEEAVLMHEMGHALGLGDTYFESLVAHQCQIGQPVSIMCSHFQFGATLQEDDKRGVLASYCRSFDHRGHASCAGAVVSTVTANSAEDGTPKLVFGVKGTLYRQPYCQTTVSYQFPDETDPRVVEYYFEGGCPAEADRDKMIKQWLRQELPFTVSNTTERLGYFEVTHITPGSAAERSGLTVGSIIPKIQDRPVQDQAEIDYIINHFHGPNGLEVCVAEKSELTTDWRHGRSLPAGDACKSRVVNFY